MLLAGAMLCVVSASADPLSLRSSPRPDPVAGYAHGLLWRIGSAAEKPNYLFGTIHSDDGRVLQLPAPVRQAFADSGTFAMEMILDETANEQIARAMRLPAGKTLEQILGPALFRRTVGVAATVGIPAVQIEPLKPWAVMTLLSVPRPKSGMFLDVQLLRWAREQGKRVIGLETPREQIRVLDGLSESEQVILLRDTVDHFGDIRRMLSDLMQAYLNRDLAALEAIAGRYLVSVGDVGARLRRRMIEDRNRRMAERLFPVLRQGGLFVAVGALHLPGRSGLLNRLARKGFTVEVVY